MEFDGVVQLALNKFLTWPISIQCSVSIGPENIKDLLVFSVFRGEWI